MTTLAILFIGYSLFSAVAIAIALHRTESLSEGPAARAMGLALLTALAGLQIAHFAWLHAGLAWPDSLPYRLALFVVAPSFHLLTRPLLHPQSQSNGAGRAWLHAVPIIASPLLPSAFAQTVAFLIGAGYLIRLGHDLMILRRERARFHIEVALLGIAVLLAVAVAVLALIPQVLPDHVFHSLYACAIGLALLLVQITLSLRPRLADEVREAARETSAPTYATSTLAHVDCEATLARLDALMTAKRPFIDPDLNLAGLAERIGLSAHQLSELLNTRLGKSFSRYVREQRIDAARTMLREEPHASVLSVGLNVGFTSQSNFYEAFREVEGGTPGQYRKRHATPAGS